MASPIGFVTNQQVTGLRNQIWLPEPNGKKKHGKWPVSLGINMKYNNNNNNGIFPYLPPTASVMQILLVTLIATPTRLNQPDGNVWNSFGVLGLDIDSYLVFEGMAPDLFTSHGGRRLFEGEGKKRGGVESCFWRIEMEDRQLNELLSLLFSLSLAW